MLEDLGVARVHVQVRLLDVPPLAAGSLQPEGGCVVTRGQWRHHAAERRTARGVARPRLAGGGREYPRRGARGTRGAASYTHLGEVRRPLELLPRHDHGGVVAAAALARYRGVVGDVLVLLLDEQDQEGLARAGRGSLSPVPTCVPLPLPPARELRSE